jgi:beta-glucosidase
MIDTARDHGVEPMVTLHHFTVPRWFAHAGGWRADDAVERFTRFTEAVTGILDDVEWVGTINEPNMVAITSGADAGDGAGSQWQSTHGLPNPSRHVSESLAAAHRASRSVLSGLGHVRSGWTVATQATQAAPGEPGAEEQAHAYSYPRDAWFLEQAVGDDWVGVQAYTRTIVGPEGPRPVAEGVERTLTGWEYYPPALAEGVRLAQRYAPGVPVFVTENGMATGDDARRRDYVQGALEGLHDTMQEGAEVLGYLYWSLLDNYEWGSFAPTFGLVGVDHETFARDVRDSARWLGRVAQANGFVE